MCDHTADNDLNPPILETHTKPLHDASKDNLLMFVVFSAEALIGSPVHTFRFLPTGTVENTWFPAKLVADAISSTSCSV